LLSPTLISIVALYPVAAFAAPVAYFQLFPEEMRELPVLPVDDTDEEARSKAIRLGVNEPLMFCGVLLCCTAMWLWLAQPVFHADGFQGKGWVSGAIKSGYVGFSWAGMWLWLWLVLSNPQRLSRAVPGYGARFLKQTVVWVIGAFSEEFWRVLCIAALTASGYSATFAVTASAIAFGVASLGEGFERSILAALEGSIFGLLFVWQRSFFAPFVAHLAVQAVYLWGVGQFSSGKLSKPWMRGIRCPVCNAQLSRLQIKIRESFDCPACHSQVSVSDGYRQAMRWVGLCAYLSLAPFTMLLLEHDVSATLGILLLWPIVFGAGTSGLLLFQRMFPPRLQFGGATFIALNLDHPRADMSDEKRE